MNELMAILEELLGESNAIETDAGGEAPMGPDAIDEVLNRPARESKVVSLKDHEALRRFRGELSAGSVSVNTVLAVLRLVHGLLRGGSE